MGSSGSAGFTLRKNYVKYLFPYECRFERGGIDPTPILAQIDAMSQKKDSRKSSSNAGMEDQWTQKYTEIIFNWQKCKKLLTVIIIVFNFKGLKYCNNAVYFSNIKCNDPKKCVDYKNASFFQSKWCNFEE